MMMGADEEWPGQAEALTSLTPAQLEFFRTFGYLQVKAAFSPQTVASLTRRADEILATEWAPTPAAGAVRAPAYFTPSEPPERQEPYLLEPVLGPVLGAAKQLMASLDGVGGGEPRMIFQGDSHLQSSPVANDGWAGRATLPADAPANADPEWTEHGWHSDIPGPSEATYPRIKLSEGPCFPAVVHTPPSLTRGVCWQCST